jgi:hypothetical protein
LGFEKVLILQTRYSRNTLKGVNVKRQMFVKSNFVFLISLALFINAQSVMAAGDSREVIYECKVVTIKGEVIEGKFIDSVAYNEVQSRPCDKNRIANKVIYRNAYTYSMLPSVRSSVIIKIISTRLDIKFL